jgi:hypothetical protein
MLYIVLEFNIFIGFVKEDFIRITFYNVIGSLFIVQLTIVVFTEHIKLSDAYF